MPYYQYDVHTETHLSQHQLAIIEKNEEDQFNKVLSQTKNRIIDLLDIFFPPRFKKKPGRFEFYPTLPSTIHRKRTLEFLQQRIRSHQIKVDGYIDNISELDNLAAENITPLLNPGLYPYFKSYAVVDYDNAGKALVVDTTLLGSRIDTITFFELVIECDLLPFELLNFEVILNLYMQWNKKQLERLIEKMKDKEGWALIDAVSYASGFYAMKSEVSQAGYISGFSLEIPLSEKPLRWRQEIRENMIEADRFQRPKGQIDNNKFPEKILTLQKKWNSIFKNAIEAMKFGDITNTGGEHVNRSDTRVRENEFFLWAKQWGYTYPSSLAFEEKNDSEQLLSRTAIKKNYTELTHDMWDKALRTNSTLLKLKIPGETAQKDRYDQAKIEKWLIEEGYYTKAELKALAEPKTRHPLL